MSKRTTTTGYVVSWLVGVAAFIVFLKSAQLNTTYTSASALATTPVATVAWIVMAIASIVMLVMWIGALIATGQAHAWGWFVALVILQLIGLGIVGMVVYAIAGPDIREPTYTRPSVT